MTQKKKSSWFSLKKDDKNEKKSKATLEKLRKVIKTALEEEIELVEATMEDGTVIVAESFEPGESVFILKDDERIALPVGNYTMNDGAVLVVTTEGVIESFTAASSDDGLTEEDLKNIKAVTKKNKELKEELEKLQAKDQKANPKLSKKKGIKSSPEGKFKKTNLSKLDDDDRPSKSQLMAMSVRERIEYAMQKTTYYNNVKLATTETITSTYAGEFAGQYIAAATLQGVTLGSNAITVKPNIKLKEVVKKVTTASILADATCDFVPTGTVTLTERILTPKELQVNLELCKTDFKSDWDALTMGFSAFDVLPPTFQAFFVQELALIVNGSVETSVWHGVEATEGQFEGLIVKMTADGDVVDQAGTTVTASNVIEELGKIVDKIPTTVYSEPDMTLYVPPNIGRAYIRALGGFGSNGLGASGINAQGTTWFNRGGGLSFDGIPIFIANGLTSNFAVAAQASNLWYGTGLLNDLNEVQVIDMAPIDGSKNVRFVLRFTAGTQFGIAKEIVLYTP